MNDVVDIYVLESFDKLVTLLAPGATFTAERLTTFNRRVLRQLLVKEGISSAAEETYISLIDEKHDMYVLQGVQDKLSLIIPLRNPAQHPICSDASVLKGIVKATQITPGRFALICKSVTGCGWELETWWVAIKHASPI